MEDNIKIPVELTPVPYEEPLNTSEPEFAVTFAPDEEMPKAFPPDPLPLTPVIVTQPDPPACTFDEARYTPLLTDPLAPRPSIVIFPLVVFTVTAAPLICTPSNVPV